MKQGYVANIEDVTNQNRNFRKVIYTGHHIQLTVMSLRPGERIGAEVHPETDQFFRVESGRGHVTINGRRHQIGSGSGIVVPAGAKHDVENTGWSPLRLYSLYAPPHHKEGTYQKTKEDTLAKDTFNGRTTE